MHKTFSIEIDYKIIVWKNLVWSLQIFKYHKINFSDIRCIILSNIFDHLILNCVVCKCIWIWFIYNTWMDLTPVTRGSLSLCISHTNIQYALIQFQLNWFYLTKGPDVYFFLVNMKYSFYENVVKRQKLPVVHEPWFKFIWPQ